MLTDEDLKKKRKKNQILEILRFCCISSDYLISLLKKLNLYENIDVENLTENKKNEIIKQLKSKLEDLSSEEISNFCVDPKKLADQNDLISPYPTSVELKSSLFEPVAGLLNPFLSIVKELFNPAKGGVLNSIIEGLNQLRINLNPQTSLTFEEQEKSQYSSLFSQAATEINQKYNKIYRDFIKKGYSNEQILYGFVKNLSNEGINKNNHKLFVEAEKQILSLVGSKSLASEGIEDLISNKIFDNLNTIYKFCFVHQENSQEYLEQINSVKNIIKDLVLKIKEQECKIKHYDITNQKKLEIYKLLRDNKKKLYHFILKTEAWKNFQTLTPEKEFNEEYIKAQFKKFPKPTIKVVYDEEAAALNQYSFEAESKNKGILKLFKNNDSNLANKEEFNNAYLEIKESLSEEIKDFIYKIDNILENVQLIEKQKTETLNYYENFPNPLVVEIGKLKGEIKGTAIFQDNILKKKSKLEEELKKITDDVNITEKNYVEQCMSLQKKANRFYKDLDNSFKICISRKFSTNHQLNSFEDDNNQSLLSQGFPLQQRIRP